MSYHRGVAVAVLGLSVGFSAAASAADFGNPAFPPVYTKEAAPWSWTGFYVGANAGYFSSTSNVTTDVAETGNYLIFCGPACGTAVGAAASVDPSWGAFIGGAQAGYNYQMNNLLLGIETDFNSFSNRASASVTQTYPGFPNIGFSTQTNVSTDWLYTLRPRFGVVTQPAMFYVTGGVAVTDLKYSEQFSDNQAGFLATEGASISQIKAGWTAGAGIESVLSSNWTAKFEYLYADFGSVSVNDTLSTISPGVGGDSFHHTADLHSNIFRVGVNYLFH
jgi:outer membrane immunogenic protein